MSWALRKSSKDCNAAATARRCRVGRAPPGSTGSVLVIVAPVGYVPVTIVNVVDMVAVLDRRVTAVVSMFVLVILPRDRVVPVQVARGERSGQADPASH